MNRNSVLKQFSMILFFFIIISLLSVWTANYNYLLSHLIGLVFGIIIYNLFSKINFEYLLKISYPLHLFSIILMLLVLIPGMGITVNGAKRWLDLGIINFQPSEIAKLTLIIYLTAAFYLKNSKRTRNKQYTAKRAFIISLISFLIILVIQRDFSTAAFMFSFYFVIYFITSRNLKYLMWGGISFTGMGILLVYTSSAYRLSRLEGWINYVFKGAEPVHQLKMSLYSFISGGKLGAGYGSGIYKNYLPAAHTDFVFSVIGEELGFLSLVAIMGLYVLVMLKLKDLAKNAKHDYELYFLFLGGYLVVAQAAINMGVTVGLFPITGLTLPLISYGRTSFLIFMMIFGLFRSIEKDIVRRKF